MEAERSNGGSVQERPDPEMEQDEEDGAATTAAPQVRTAPPRAPRRARGQPLRNTVTKLERLVINKEGKLTALRAIQEKLQAKLTAMQHWCGALEGLAAGTQPLRAAGAAAATTTRASGYWSWQEQVVRECLAQLDDLRQQLGADVIPPPLPPASQGSSDHSSSGSGNSGSGARTLSGEADKAGAGDRGSSPVGSSMSHPTSSGGSSGTAADGSADGAAVPPTGARRRHGWEDKLLQDGETVEAALKRLVEHTPESVAKCYRAFVRMSAVDLHQVKGATTDPLGAGARLQEGLDRAMALTAGLLVANPLVYVRAHTLRWDTLAPMEKVAPPELWGRCVQQMQLTREQELVTTALLEKWRTSIAPVMARREQLLQRQSQHAGRGGGAAAAKEEPGSGLGVGLGLNAGDEEDLLLSEVERCNVEYLWRVTAFAFALFSRVFTAQQSAALFVNAFPYAPMLMSIETGLQEVIVARGAQGEAQGATAAPPA